MTKVKLKNFLLQDFFPSFLKVDGSLWLLLLRMHGSLNNLCIESWNGFIKMNFQALTV